MAYAFTLSGLLRSKNLKVVWKQPCGAPPACGTTPQPPTFPLTKFSYCVPQRLANSEILFLKNKNESKPYKGLRKMGKFHLSLRKKNVCAHAWMENEERKRQINKSCMSRL
ncbi:hypothetical protein TRVL_00182 [Trypanosoma vivax]|nr:hypothetical protein TRVL_00182 [Trypanosoma vivax]